MLCPATTKHIGVFNKLFVAGKAMKIIMKFKPLLVTGLILSASLLLPSCRESKNISSEINSDINISSARKDHIDSQFMPDIESSWTAPAAANTGSEAVIATDSLSGKKIGWGQGVQVDKNNRPVSCDAFNQKYGKYNAVFAASADKKKLYLTFDEGYENGYTEKILDVLKSKKAPAVFFVTKDYVKANRKLIKRMIDEGHIVGNHSWSHPSMPELSEDRAKEEITKLHDYVSREFGYTMTLFRPPMGEFSEKTLAVTKQAGYKSVFWSFAYKDWITDSQPDKDQALKKTVKALHPGAVYLLHAVSKTNAAILGDFIDRARKDGYEVAAFDF